MHQGVDDLKIGSSSLEYRSASMPSDEIDFLGYSRNYFVCFIDIVNSTKIVSSIDDSIGIRKYYGIFLNTLARIVRDYNGKIVKNAGDSLILYFPATADITNANGFNTAMRCCLKILDAHESMNLIANYERLPKIDYRISADYGKVEIAKSRSSTEFDLLGNTMNICSKMNSKAKPQGFVIGSDLYEILKGLTFPFDSYYNFHLVGEYSTGLKFNYPIFAVQPKDNIRNGHLIPDSDSGSGGIISGSKKYDADYAPPVRRRIMIIDDEPDVLLTYKSMLEDEAAFEVDTFTSSQDALQNLFSKGTNFYDLIITDIRMPPPNGLQLYNIIKSVNKQTRVLFVTAYDVIEEVVSMLPDVRHDHVLKKPIRKLDLVREVKSCAA